MNPNYPHPIFAREGWPYIGGTFLLAVLWTSFADFGFIAAILWVLFLLVLQFFRDPPRVVPTAPDAVLCPVDGQVVKVEKKKNPFKNHNRCSCNPSNDPVLRRNSGRRRVRRQRRR